MLLSAAALALVVIQCVMIVILWRRSDPTGGAKVYLAETEHTSSVDHLALQVEALRSEMLALRKGSKGTPEEEYQLIKKSGPPPPSKEPSPTPSVETLALSTARSLHEEEETVNPIAGRRPIIPAPAVNDHQPEFEMPACAIHAPTYETMGMKDLRALMEERDLDEVRGKQAMVDALRADDRKTPSVRARDRAQRKKASGRYRRRSSDGCLYTPRDGVIDENDAYNSAPVVRPARPQLDPLIPLPPSRDEDSPDELTP